MGAKQSHFAISPLRGDLPIARSGGTPRRPIWLVSTNAHGHRKKNVRREWCV